MKPLIALGMLAATLGFAHHEEWKLKRADGLEFRLAHLGTGADLEIELKASNSPGSIRDVSFISHKLGIGKARALRIEGDFLKACEVFPDEKNLPVRCLLQDDVDGVQIQFTSLDGKQRSILVRAIEVKITTWSTWNGAHFQITPFQNRTFDADYAFFR